MVYRSTPLWYMGVLPYGIQEYSLMVYGSTPLCYHVIKRILIGPSPLQISPVCPQTAGWDLWGGARPAHAEVLGIPGSGQALHQPGWQSSSAQPPVDLLAPLSLTCISLLNEVYSVSWYFHITMATPQHKLGFYLHRGQGNVKNLLNLHHKPFIYINPVLNKLMILLANLLKNNWRNTSKAS